VGLGQTLLLGAIAGGTIVLGLPIGRLQRPAPILRVMLNAIAVGVLVFHTGDGNLGPAFGYGALFVGGLAVGLLSLVAYEGWINRIAATPVQESGTPVRRGVAGWSPARRLALLIAVGIGLHNFAEGLAIGQSAGSGEIALATLLVIGFALHNATEGFGITAPLAGDLDENGSPRRPSWPFLLTLGLIGGGPTFVGTAVGHGFTSEALSVVFLTLAAGSILYVVIQLIGVAARAKRADLLAYGLLIGMIAGFVTDAVVTAGGA
jgi:ZIP family zinc transporter